MKIIKLLILLLVSCSLSAKAGVVKISGSLKQFGLDRVSMNSGSQQKSIMIGR